MLTHCSILCFVGNSNEIDIVHHVDTEANIATEVCLTILDLLSLFTQVHQVNMIMFSAKMMIRVEGKSHEKSRTLFKRQVMKSINLR
jgi:hypothetical protein